MVSHPSKNFRDRRVEMIIIAVSLLMMLAVANLPFKAKPFGDITFHAEAKNMALFIKGKIPYREVVITKAPGPVLFYTPAYLLAPSDATDGELWYFGVGLSAILISISLVLIFRAAKLLFSRKEALLSLFLFFIFPIQCYYSLGILAEAPAFFSLALASYGWAIAYLEPGRKTGWIWMIAGLWLLILNRPNTLLLPLLGLAVIAYAWMRNPRFYNLYGKRMFISFLCTILLCTGVTTFARIITKGKTDQDQSALLYSVAHQGRFQFREEPFDFRFWDGDSRGGSKDYLNWVKSQEALAAIAEKSGRNAKDVCLDFLISDAFEHPFWFARQFAVKCLYGQITVINSVTPANFTLGPLRGAAGYWFFILLINTVNLFILCGAIVFMFRRKHLVRYWIFWGTIASLLLFHGLTYMEPRYIFPSRVVLYIIGAAGWCSFERPRRIMASIEKRIFSTSPTEEVA